MTTICKNGYVFEVDVEETANYYKTHLLCECDNCKNYYAQINGKFPKLEEFLSGFGIEISKPDEIFSVESEGSVDYFNIDYTACGRISEMSNREIEIYDSLPLGIAVTDGFASPNSQKGDYFTLSVWGIELPWVLDKDFPKPIPAEKRKELRRKRRIFGRKEQ